MKVFIDTMGIKSANLKDKFLFYSFAAFQSAQTLGKAADCQMLLRMIREIKLSSNWLRYILHSFLHHKGVLRIQLSRCFTKMFRMLQIPLMGRVTVSSVAITTNIFFLSTPTCSSRESKDTSSNLFYLFLDGLPLTKTFKNRNASK